MLIVKRGDDDFVPMRGRRTAGGLLCRRRRWDVFTGQAV